MKTKCNPSVAVIVLNWNRGRDTIECLESLLNLNYKNFSIFLVDNNSTDGSVEKIKKWCDRNEGISYTDKDNKIHTKFEFSKKNIVIIKNKENCGYAGGNNTGIKWAMTYGDYSYFWILNNDTVVNEFSLAEMIKIGEKEKRAGILGSRIMLYGDKKNYPCMSGLGLKVVWPKFFFRDNKQKNNIFEVKWVSGASFLIKKKVIDDIGLLDEDYFLYGEEKELCIRAIRKGWKIYLVGESLVYHKEGASTDTKIIYKKVLGKMAKRLPLNTFKIKLYYESRNGIYFVKKHYPYYLLPYFFLRTLHLIWQVILYDDDKVIRVGVILRGAFHGIIGRMGREKSLS